ncbi:MAG: UDP-glucose/GDP-mannose dehydrogenase family protein [Ignavibacteriaceae bacterium]|nr:UDP-glucose/GDP-mannose dehydrogenase family protein [Ignavibacteriaceae bacterium]
MKVAVVGSGYVGLVTGTCLADVGNNVICVDNNPVKLEKLLNSEIPIFEPGLDIIFYKNIAKKRLTFTGDLKRALIESEIIFLCLPTPQGEDGSADLQYVSSVANDIGKFLKEEPQSERKVIVNKSTVPVGTARKVKDIISSYGVDNFDVVSNPEFLREGFAVDDFMKPDRIVVGADSDYAFSRMKLLYEPFVRQGNPIFEMNFESSELTKYAANSYLAMRITFMNELANLCEVVGANVDLVRKGMGSDTRIGKRFLFPGIGYGGSCFPKDVKALIKTSSDYHKPMTILETVDSVNNNQKSVLVEKIMDFYGGDIKGKKFAVWGLAFKPNTDDMREAPAVVIIKKLLEKGAVVSAYDPEAMDNAKFYLDDLIDYAQTEYAALDEANALIIATEWNDFRTPDFEVIKSKVTDNVIFDGRNVFEPGKMKELGFNYFSIGRAPLRVS